MKSKTKYKAEYWISALAVDSERLNSVTKLSEKLIREYLVYFKDSIKNLEGVLDE